MDAGGAAGVEGNKKQRTEGQCHNKCRSPEMKKIKSMGEDATKTAARNESFVYLYCAFLILFKFKTHTHTQWRTLLANVTDSLLYASVEPLRTFFLNMGLADFLGSIVTLF